jgi:uncharacterized protein YjbI with pentapeptide repeats
MEGVMPKRTTDSDQPNRAIICGANFVSARFQDANMRDAEFIDVSLAGANFNDVDLSHAVFENVDITGLVINGVNIAKLMEPTQNTVNSAGTTGTDRY